MAENINDRKHPRMFGRRWWRADPERVKWAATLGLIAVLLAGGMYLDARNNDTRPQPILAEADPSASAAAAMSAEAGSTAPRVEPPVEDPPLTAPAANQSAAIEEPEPAPPATEALATRPMSLSMPVSAAQGGELQRGYGYTWDPTHEDHRFHRGVDLTINEGGAVYAAAAGTVVEASSDPYWGGLMKIEHAPGWYSIYRGVAAGVAVGDSVNSGALIGHHLPAPAELAQTAHVHIELESDGQTIDPLSLLQ